jgi:GH24 family phage-related lysozyme (muramidase)
MTFTYHVLFSETDYTALRFQILEKLEGVEQSAYRDTKHSGRPSIGVGFNLRTDNVFRAVMSAMDISDSGQDAGYRQEILNTVTQDFGSDSALQTALNGIMARRARAMAEAGTPVDRSTFTLSDSEIKAVFDSISDTYETRVRAAVGQLPFSQERIALFSLAYNSVTGPTDLLGGQLRAAIASGNRPEAWYQIRYQSNGNSGDIGAGIAKRRYFESQLFGLYNEDILDPDVEYKNIVQM